MVSWGFKLTRALVGGAALLAWLVGGPRRDAAAAARHLQLLGTALNCDPRTRNGSDACNLLPTLVAWLQEALALAADELAAPPKMGAGVGAARGLMVRRDPGALAESLLMGGGLRIGGRLGLMGLAQGLGVLGGGGGGGGGQRTAGLEALVQPLTIQLERAPGQRGVRDLNGRVIRVDPLVSLEGLAEYVASVAALRWHE
jgi:hypothetical protein